MSVQQTEGHLVERAWGAFDLSNDVDAVAIRLDHPGHFPDMTSCRGLTMIIQVTN